MQKFLRNDFTTLAARIGVLYVVWFLCRIVFYLQNAESIGELSWAELPLLFRGAMTFDTVSILYVNSLFIVLSLLPFRFREKVWYQKMLLWIYGVTNTIAIVINVSDGVYFHYARKRFTADEFSYLSNNDNSTSIIFKSMGENWHILLWGLFVIFAVIWLYRIIGYRPTRIKSKLGYYGVNTLLLLCTVWLVVGGMRGGFSRQTRPITLSNATHYTSSAQKANLILSNPFCMLRTIGNKGIAYVKFYDEKTLDELYNPYHYPTGGQPNIGKRNVLIFILESFSSEHSALLNPDLYPDGKGFTPYLDSLMQEGYYFTNAYSNGRKSIDALPSVLASIPSYRTPFLLMPQALAEMKPLPAILSEEGYTTSFFNGSSKGSMGFGAFASLAGIKNEFTREDYEKVNGNGDFDGYWGIWDMPFMQYMESVISKQKEPFFATIFTLTSHHPFVVPPPYDSLPAGRTKVHKGVAYTDLSVREFMNSASKESWFKNTIFVFVADHVSSETFAPKTLTPVGNSHIISFIYTPDGSIRGTDNTVAQQIDIMPTVLGLLGYDKPYFAFGRDVLRENDRRAMAVNVYDQTFQAITDSLVMYFDGKEPTAVYSMADTLQKKNIVGEKTEYMNQLERDLKARLQQYYRHVEKQDYIVK